MRGQTFAVKGNLTACIDFIPGKPTPIRQDRHNAINALGAIAVARNYFEEFFHDFDAIVTPSATGAAPPGLAATGDPVFSTLWTFCGLPCLSLPLLQGANDLPIGVQLVSALEDDARLCRTANWFLSYLADAKSVD